MTGGLHPMSAGAAARIQGGRWHRMKARVVELLHSRRLRRRAIRRLRALRLANGNTLYYSPK